jgi:RHS repeat-associated protein
MTMAAQLSENSHQGFDGLKAALCLGAMKAKPNTASGMAVCLWRNGIGSRSSGKERDAETGLDYFLARYYSGAQGRFMSHDPFNVVTQSENKREFDTYLRNPANWNAYAYAWNNPLRYTDPTGETVYIIAYTEGNESGDDEFRWVAESIARNIKKSKGYDPKKDKVLVRGIDSFDDLKG